MPVATAPGTGAAVSSPVMGQSQAPQLLTGQQVTGGQPWNAGQDFNNPFGTPRKPNIYGEIPIVGGMNDLNKTIATRNIGIQGLTGMLGTATGQPPPGLMSALQGGASSLGGKLAGEEFSNISPAINRGYALYGDQLKNQIAQGLNNAYVLGGAISGSGQQAWAQAKALDKARRLAHVQSVQAILQGVGSGLGGGGGMGGMGGGGGGGGGGDMITNLVSGIYGAAAY